MTGFARSILVIIAGVFMVSINVGWAFDCPNIHKAVTDYYEKTAKVSGVDQTKLAEGKQSLDDGMKKHSDGQHKDAIKQMANALQTINEARP